MFKRSLYYFSAMVASIVMISLMVPIPAKACGEMPQTLLSLYMNSELVVVGKYIADGNSTKSDEDEYGYSLNTEREISIIKVLRGPEDLKSVSFLHYEYHSIPVNQEADYDRSYEYQEHEDYFDSSKIKIGDQYLFFFTKETESPHYTITDFSSGVKEIDGKLHVYERFINDLKAIVETSEKRSERLTEWIVNLIEADETRMDGVTDLAESYYGNINYEEIADNSDSDPFVINDDYGIYTVGLFKHLTESQKARISATLFPMLQEAWFGAEPVYMDYSISTVLGNINRPQLAINVFNMLKSVDIEDSERKIMIMEFLNDVLQDSEFSEIYYEYAGLEYKIADSEKDQPPIQNQILEARKVLLRNLEKRFNYLLLRNFIPEETSEA